MVESIQYLELIADGHGSLESREAGFVFEFTMTSPGCAARLSGPPEDCWPAEAAEFELDSIHVISEDGNHTQISEEVFAALVGPEIEEKMRYDAETEVQEQGDY